MYFYSKEDLLKAEHNTLVQIVCGEETGDYVLGGVNGVLRFVGELINAKEEGDN
jgi:hypothetical protein